MTAIEDRIAAGAAFLDEHDPGWWRADVDRAIDLAVLDLGAGDRCILGQRCPVEVLGAFYGVAIPAGTPDGWWEGAYEANAVRLSGLRGWDLRNWAAARGFNTPPDAAANYRDLATAWRRLIGQRRAAA